MSGPSRITRRGDLDPGLKQWLITGVSIAVSFIPLVGPLLSCVIDGTFTDMWEAIKRGALDARLKALQKESGVAFLGHHTLRRPGGRLMWLAKVPIETIASVMGHESTEMTLRYIGINLGDQCKAFEAVRNLRIQMQKTTENVPFATVPEV